MTYQQAVREFRETNSDLYENEVDYWIAQQAWAFYTDALCKAGQITERQYNTWATPFTYGKPLKVTKRYSR